MGHPVTKNIDQLYKEIGELKAQLADVRSVESALRESEERFRMFVNCGPAVAFLKSEDGKMLWINRQCERAFGIRLSEWEGKSDEDLWPKSVARQLRENDLAVLAGNITVEYLERVPGPEGDRYWLSFKFPFTDSKGKRFIGGVALDITEKKRSENELRETRERLERLSHRLMEIQETERRDVARELHDEIGQALTAVKINLQTMQINQPSDSQKEYIRESIQIVDRAILDVRNLSVALRPSILDDLGLIAALRWYLDRIALRAGFVGHFAARGMTARPPALIETTCFRLVQEALTNIVRHSHAQNVYIKLSKGKQNLQLTIKDDGSGFNVSEAKEKALAGGSFGVLGMQERVYLIGGKFEIHSAKNKGTELIAQFPNHLMEAPLVP